MTEENENKEQECTCEETCDCGCQEGKECTCEETCDCGCDEFEEYDKYCSRTENLLTISAVANIITTILVAIIALILVFGGTDFNFGDKSAKNHQPEVKALFKDKGMTIEEAMQDDKYAVVLFYADWCPHCQNFAPTFKKLSKDRKLKKRFNFVRINSEDPKSVPFMEEYEVKGFPSVYLVNTKNGHKQHISNGLLFGDGAKETLIEIFNNFADDKDKE